MVLLVVLRVAVFGCVVYLGWCLCFTIAVWLNASLFATVFVVWLFNRCLECLNFR